ncbi:MAG: hypothetical protein ACRCU1_05695 [Alsobacter sp.]
MDSLLLLFLDCLAMIGWVVGSFRRGGAWWIKLGAIPSIVVLTFHFIWTVVTTPPELVAGVEANEWVVAAMALGVCALLSSPKRGNDNGGALSA